MSARRLIPRVERGRCKVCGCVDDVGCVTRNSEAFADACSWVDDSHTLCSACTNQGPLATHSRELFDSLAAVLRFNPAFRKGSAGDEARARAREVLELVRKRLRADPSRLFEREVRS